jgi:hypothetical protein
MAKTITFQRLGRCRQMKNQKWVSSTSMMRGLGLEQYVQCRWCGRDVETQSTGRGAEPQPHNSTAAIGHRADRIEPAIHCLQSCKILRNDVHNSKCGRIPNVEKCKFDEAHVEQPLIIVGWFSPSSSALSGHRTTHILRASCCSYCGALPHRRPWPYDEHSVCSRLAVTPSKLE